MGNISLKMLMAVDGRHIFGHLRNVDGFYDGFSLGARDG